MDKELERALRLNVESILQNIKDIRLKRNLSQEGIAEKMQIDTSTFSKIENGKIELTAIRLAHLAHVFSMSIIDIISYPHVLINPSGQPERKNVKAILQIELDQEKKDQVIKLVFGQSVLEILNK